MQTTKVTKADYINICNQVNAHSYNYYVLSAPTISDAEFDAMYNSVVKIEKMHPEWVTESSPTQHVGSDLKSGTLKFKHLRPMLSLRKVNSESQLNDFINGIKGKAGSSPVLTLEHKYDGLSISLIYEDGVLVRAVTRGDSIEGEDVTANARMIKSIPQDISNVLPESLFGRAHILEVRGEVLMTYAAFNNLNAQMKRNGRAEYSNPRNAASGILRGSSPSSCQMLTMMAWDAINHDCRSEKFTNGDVLSALESLGFKMAGAWVVSGIEEAMRFITLIGKSRDTLKYPIDGAVAKVYDRRLWSVLGETEREPRWAVAYKYATDEWETTFRRVEWSASDSTGRLTPVAVFDEVEMYGTKCCNANLSSYNTFIEKMSGIREGDKVIVTKANEVIPKVLRWYSAGGSGAAAITPVVCPVCGSPVKVLGAHTFCTRPDKHAAARAAMEKPVVKPMPERVNKYALCGMSVVVSGEFTKKLTRSQIDSLVVQAGGKLVKSISGKTAFMVAGDVKPGPSKTSKCMSLGIPMISEEEFLRRII